MNGKELFIRFITRAFRKLLSIYVFSYFPCGFEGWILDLIVSSPDHCLSFYFSIVFFFFFFFSFFFFFFFFLTLSRVPGKRRF